MKSKYLLVNSLKSVVYSFFLLMWLSACSRVSFYPIEGTVKDYETGKPVPNVPVVLRIRGSQLMAGLPHVPSSACLYSSVTISDENGLFRFPTLHNKVFWLRKRIGWSVAAYRPGYQNVSKLNNKDKYTGKPYLIMMEGMQPNVEPLLLTSDLAKKNRVSYLHDIAMSYGGCRTENTDESYNKLFISKIYQELIVLVSDDERGNRDIKYLCDNGATPKLKFDPETRTCVGLLDKQ